MRKSCVVKILFALIVICIQKCTSDKTVEQIKYLWQPKHWDHMTWFDRMIGAPIKKNTRKGVDVKNQLWTMTNISIAAKMKIIPLLMECGYGKKLIDFLRISTYTVVQCGELLSRGEGNAVDCWQKLDYSLQKGAIITYKLWAMNKQINALDKRITDDNQFYEFLPQIHKLLKRPQPGLTAKLYDDIESLATSLVIEWNKSCEPSYSVISQEELQGEYERPDLNEPPKLLYDFYVDRLNSTTESIKKDTEDIGFQYKPSRKTVIFSKPTRIDGSSSSHQ